MTVPAAMSSSTLLPSSNPGCRLLLDSSLYAKIKFHFSLDNSSIFMCAGRVLDMSFSKRSTFQIIERFNWRLPGYIGYGNDRFSFSHVDDIVEGHIAAMEKGRPGERYLFTGDNASFRHAFDIAAIITGTARPNFNIPLVVIEVYGWVSVLFARITGKLPFISPPTVHVLRHQWA